MQIFLLSLITLASVLSLLGVLPYQWFQIPLAALALAALCVVFNRLLSRIFRTSGHDDSAIITGLILALIFGPLEVASQAHIAVVLAGIAMASKYILAFKHRHFFNPAALTAVIAWPIIGESASWWIGSWHFAPLVALGGSLVTHKTGRQVMVVALLGTIITSSAVKSFFGSGEIGDLDQIINPLIHSPILFFATVMLLEPVTSPSNRRQQAVYAVIVGLVLSWLPSIISGFQQGFELALLTGNIYTRIVKKGITMKLTLAHKKKLSENITSFIFEATDRLKFTPGQFLEWTLPHAKPDSRGQRRYFTISSSPTESHIALTTKFAGETSSSFKKTLFDLELGQEIIAANLDGEFVLPNDAKSPLVFIAGGIGVTPYRSMIKWLLDTGNKRKITLLYSAKKESELIFRDLFSKAEKEIGLKTVYVLTDQTPTIASARKGFIDQPMITEEVPNWQQSLFYISGPEPMVEAFEKMLSKMGVPSSHIKRDFFLGYEETYQLKQGS